MSKDVKKGLVGVVAGETAISSVVAESNSLIYRGYPVQNLAEYCSFESVAHLLWTGELPDEAALANFCEQERRHRQIDTGLTNLIAALAFQAHPMDCLRTAVSYMGADSRTAMGDDGREPAEQARRLLAQIPTVVATQIRLRRGQIPLAPRPDLSLAENFFYMAFGRVPEPEIVRCFEISLILYAEHGFNASTFTARTIASSQSDLYSAIVGAIGSLKGPLHGGANEAVMRMLLEIGEPDRAAAWIEQALAERRIVMGFGHRVYKAGDSRVPIMDTALDKVAALRDGEKWLEIERILADIVHREKGLHPNLDYPAGPAYYLMGFDIDFFTPIFVMSRITGWAAHILEQIDDNTLIRPLSQYTGPAERSIIQPSGSVVDS